MNLWLWFLINQTYSNYKDLQNLESKLLLFCLPDGDVAGSILTCIVDSDVDMLYGIGAPEGRVISLAAVIRALGGDMQARLKLRSEVKGNSWKW